MNSLLRRTCAFTERQMAHLVEKATRMQTSIADIIRRLVDEDIDKK